MEQAYMVSSWRVSAGQEEAFRAAWLELAAVFVGSQNPALFGVLLQHETDRSLFYSFGPWNSMADVEAMRRSPEAQDAFLRVTALCDEAQPGAYHLVEFVERPRHGQAAVARRL
jgi:quinol monooxygenase YgiN